ncbi:hypothetical protein VNI00_009334 [Paramarasmius palmivorus]|uniref:F-box domain-containing protein n=1 Tax=Paramarasmius palmivorus TaxID=297713 RepID=A0AAW0CNN5_9AGAR
MFNNYPHLPIELLSAIFDHVPNPSDTRKCSLVCRGWVPITRNYGFRRLEIRHWHHLDKLLHLCENELETLTNANVREVAFLTVHAMHSGWPSERFAKMFGASIHTLRLEGNGFPWERAPRGTTDAILKEFGNSISRLEIVRFSFQSPATYAAVLRSFPFLNSLELAECYHSHPNTTLAPQLQVSMDQVTDMTLRSHPWGAFPHIYEPLVHFNALKALRIRPSYIPSDPEALSLQRIIEEAGDNLEELDFEVKVLRRTLTQMALQGHFLLRSLDISKNTNLRTLRVAFRFTDSNVSHFPTEYLLPILQRVAQTANSSARRLEFLDLPYILEHEMNWNAVDELLVQHPFFSCLKEVTCKGFVCCYSETDCVDGDYRRPSETSEPGRRAKEAIERLRTRLRRCDEKGILEVGVNYQLLSIVAPASDENQTTSVSEDASSDKRPLHFQGAQFGTFCSKDAKMGPETGCTGVKDNPNPKLTGHLGKKLRKLQGLLRGQEALAEVEAPNPG